LIENATITALQTPAASDRFGDPNWNAATNLSARCCLDNTENAQRIIRTSKQKDSTAVLYVLMSAIGSITIGSKISVTFDPPPTGPGGSTTYEVTDRKEFVKAGGLSHHQCLLKEME
jgi:hypothetical protein